MVFSRSFNCSKGVIGSDGPPLEKQCGCFDTSVKGGEMMEYIICFALLVTVIVLIIKK